MKAARSPKTLTANSSIEVQSFIKFSHYTRAFFALALKKKKS